MTAPEKRYRVVKHTARNWAEKIGTVREVQYTGLTEKQATDICRAYNETNGVDHKFKLDVEEE